MNSFRITDALTWLQSLDRDQVVEILKKIATLYSRNRRNSDVIVIGPGGVGKTTLCHQIVGSDPLELPLVYNYTQDFLDRSGFAGSLYQGKVIDTPGQERLRDNDDWNKEKDKVRNGKYSGVIFVCSYGYHNTKTPAAELELTYRKRDFIDDFLIDKRNKELDDFSELSRILGEATSKIWLLFLIMKEDLWFDENKTGKVSRFYLDQSSKFWQRIDDVVRTLGKKNFKYEVVLGSSLIRNFVVGENDVKGFHSVYYDSERQIASMMRILFTLNNLVEWKSK